MGFPPDPKEIENAAKVFMVALLMIGLAAGVLVSLLTTVVVVFVLWMSK